MQQFRVVKLKNLTPFHIGTGKENYDFSASELASDTLSAALVAIKAQNGDDRDLSGFLDSFAISSAFPFIGERFFLPKLQGKLNIKVEGCEEAEVRKKLKKVKYLDSVLWADVISGRELVVSKEQLNGAYLIAANTSIGKPFENLVTQRVTIARDEHEDAKPFFFNWTYTNSDAGLYCLVECADKIFDELFKLFEQLGESGIGTDRAVGGGRFDVDKGEMNINSPAKANSIALLSLYIPKEEEMEQLNIPNSRYELVKRDGYISGSQVEAMRHLRKKSIYMFSVGSIFRTITPLEGKIVDLRPEWNDGELHPVYRSGKPICIPVID